MFCDSVQQTDQGKMVAVGLFYRLIPPVFPSAFTFGCIAEAHDLPVGNGLSVAVRLLDPSGNVVHEMLGDNTLTDTSRPHAFLGIEFRNVLLMDAGVYTVEILVNGEVLGQRSIHAELERGQ